MRRHTPMIVLASLLVACASDNGGRSRFVDTGGGLAGVGQGGAQDFGRFRQILDAGGIPGPDTLDEVGFFHEHVIEMPPPECGQQVCLHGRFGTMGNMISGSPCTVVLLGMNTTVTPSSVARPALHLTVVLDTSGSMLGPSIDAVRAGLRGMLPELRDTDLVSMVGFGTRADVLAEALAPDDPALIEAIDELSVGGSTNVYDGLRRGYELAEAHRLDDGQNRLLLLSDGVVTSGIDDPDRIRALARGHSELGYGLSTVGMGTEFDLVLMRSLAEEGAGAFYFVEDVQAVDEVFREEVHVFVVPLAEQAEIAFTPTAEWDLRGVYGTRLAQLDPGKAIIDLPTLQLAGRTAPSDNESGRRGGGGAIVLELLPDGPTPKAGTVGELAFHYVLPQTGEERTQEITVVAPELAEQPEGWFTDRAVEKSFVMLNVYVAFSMAAERAARGDDPAALAVLDAVEGNVDRWLRNEPDPDIADDLVYVRRFIENLEMRAGGPNRSPVQIQEPWPRD